MTKAAFIFDHDGTLVDSETLHYECWRRLLLNYDVELTEEEYIRDHNGVPTLKNAENLIDTYRLNTSSEVLADTKRKMFAQRSATQAPDVLPTVIEALRVTQRLGLKTAIATGASDEDLARSLDTHRLFDYFNAVATNGEVSNGKPAPDVYLLACERLSIEPKNAYAFEDTEAGIAAAKSAGLYCVAIPNAYSVHQDLSQADQQCDNLLRAVYHAFEVAH